MGNQAILQRGGDIETRCGRMGKILKGMAGRTFQREENHPEVSWQKIQAYSRNGMSFSRAGDKMGAVGRSQV